MSNSLTDRVDAGELTIIALSTVEHAAKYRPPDYIEDVMASAEHVSDKLVWIEPKALRALRAKYRPKLSDDEQHELAELESIPRDEQTPEQSGRIRDLRDKRRGYPFEGMSGDRAEDVRRDYDRHRREVVS